MSERGPLHMIYPYAGAQQYLEGSCAYIEAARAADAAVVIAAPPEHRAALVASLAETIEADVAARSRR